MRADATLQHGGSVGLLLRLAALAAALVALVPALRLVLGVTAGDDFFGHAYAVPLAAALALWRNRAGIAAALWSEPPALGWLACLIASLALVVALFADMVFMAGLAIPALLAATAYAIGGRPLLRNAWVGLLLLVFMVPPPGFVVRQLLFPLKLVVTETSGRVLQALGWSVAWQGNEILVPGHTLFVADACSGLTSIVTLLPLAALVAYLASRRVWRRLVIVASVIPLSLLANVLRVTVTVALVGRLGPDVAAGSLHESFGLITYLIGTLALLGVARVLR